MVISGSKHVQQSFGRVLKELRIFKELSQEELGARAEVHRTYISMLERGHRAPTLTVLVELAAALGISLEVLIEKFSAELAQNGEKT